MEFPKEGFVRLKRIVGDEKADPPIPAFIPISPATWWAGVKSGRYPKPIKLSPKVTVWRVEDIRALVDSKSAAEKQIILEPAVMKRTNLSKIEIKNLVSQGTFPAPITQNAGFLGWSESDINYWIEAKNAFSRNNKKKRKLSSKRSGSVFT